MKTFEHQVDSASISIIDENGKCISVGCDYSRLPLKYHLFSHLENEMGQSSGIFDNMSLYLINQIAYIQSWENSKKGVGTRFTIEIILRTGWREVIENFLHQRKPGSRPTIEKLVEGNDQEKYREDEV